MDWSGGFVVAAGALMLLLAGWLVYLNPASRVHRAFALFLVVRSVINIIPGIRGIAWSIPPGWSELTEGAFLMVLPPVGVYLIVTLVAYFKGQRASPVWTWICVVVGAVAATVFLLKPLLIVDFSFAFEWVPAPLQWWTWCRFLVYAAAGWIFARQFMRRHDQAQGQSAYLVSLGFILNAALFATFGATALAFENLGQGWGWNKWSLAAVLMASGVLVLATLVVLAGLAKRVPSARRGVAVYATLTLSAAAAGTVLWVTAWASGATGTGVWQTGYLVADGLTTVLMPILLAHAILRHGILGMERGVAVTLRRGTVAALLLVAFFVATEMATNFFQFRGGWIFGSVAAGVVLFAAQPLQRAAERLTNLPGAGKGAATPTGGVDMLDLYRDHLRVVWADGNVSAKERALLRQLRDRLGLSLADADRLEEEILRA